MKRAGFSTRSRFLLLVAFAATSLVLQPSAAAARDSQECNTFCWHDCTTVSGSWCVAPCGLGGLQCMPYSGVCASVGLATVHCWADQT